MHGHGRTPLTALWGTVDDDDGVVHASEQLEVVAEVLVRSDDHKGGVLRTQHLWCRDI